MLELLREIERRLELEAEREYPEFYMAASRRAFVENKLQEIARLLVDMVVRPD
jgi:hypothetical protein